jgi:osmotically-inducible protein OsmY
MSSRKSRRTAGCATSITKLLPLAAACFLFSGCFWVVVGAGAGEAGYIAGQKDRTAGETVNDQWIHTKITAKLSGEDKLKSRHIDVDVNKGVVTLKGVAYSAEERRLAVALAKDTKGVTQVVDKLTVP